MLTWLRRLFNLADPAELEPVTPTALERRMDELEERLDYLHMQYKRLRGRVTGAVRHDDQDAPETPIPHQPTNHAILNARRKLRGF